MQILLGIGIIDQCVAQQVSCLVQRDLAHQLDVMVGNVTEQTATMSQTVLLLDQDLFVMENLVSDVIHGNRYLPVDGSPCWSFPRSMDHL